MPHLIHFNVTDTIKALAIGDDLEGDTYGTVAVLSESEAEGLTPGQVTFKHGIKQGDTAGTWAD